MDTIGLGITTYNRPDYLQQCLNSIQETCKDKITALYIYNDGSTVEYPTVIDISWYPKVVQMNAKINYGVAHAKNQLLKRMLEDGMKHIFLIEDDILIKDGNVFQEYIRAGEVTGFHHFNFAHHGPANAGGFLYRDDNVDYYPHCVGAFSYYTAESLKELERIEEEKNIVYPGLMDENFINALEHVEHTKRLGDNGLTSPWGWFVDIVDSKRYLQEIPGSIDYSSIRPQKNWKQNQKKALKYWEKKWAEKPPVQLPK